MPRFVLAANHKSGTALSDGSARALIIGKLDEHFPGLECHFFSGRDIIQNLQAISADPELEVLIVAGGDGTVSAAANLFAHKGVTLAVLPLGTMNLTARALGMPLVPLEAAEALANADTRSIDLGCVNERYFVHHVSLGLHPRLIRLRDKMVKGSKLGKVWASLRAFPSVIRRPKMLDINVEIDGRTDHIRSPALMISNNRFGRGHIPFSDAPDKGELGLYCVQGKSWSLLTRAAVHLLSGQAEASPQLQILTGRTIVLNRHNGHREFWKISVDGELVTMESQLQVQLMPKALSVLTLNKFVNTK